MQTAHSRSRVVDGYTPLIKKADDVVFSERFVFSIDQTHGVAIEHQAEDFPHHIGAVGVKKLHAPPRTGWRETAQHQQPCLGWKERLEGMHLNIRHDLLSIIVTAGHVADFREVKVYLVLVVIGDKGVDGIGVEVL